MPRTEERVSATRIHMRALAPQGSSSQPCHRRRGTRLPGCGGQVLSYRWWRENRSLPVGLPTSNSMHLSSG